VKDRVRPEAALHGVVIADRFRLDAVIRGHRDVELLRSELRPSWGTKGSCAAKADTQNSNVTFASHGNVENEPDGEA
jgi:hypothetical protein